MTMIWVANGVVVGGLALDRKSTRLNSSHVSISYAVFCLKKKIHGIFTISEMAFAGMTRPSSVSSGVGAEDGRPAALVFCLLHVLRHLELQLQESRSYSSL